LDDSVSAIAPNAFEYSTFTSVTIPSSVKYIGDYAFDGDSSVLTTVTFAPNSQLESIGKLAFGTRLESIEIPRSVTTIAQEAFRSTSALTSVTFEANSQLVSIGEDAFRSSGIIGSIEIPRRVTTIGMGAFRDTSALTSVTFEPNSQLDSIGDEAFLDAISLTSITIPDRVTSIGEAAFSNATFLTSITIPDSVTSIGEAAFANANSLTNVIFGANSQLERISSGAFYGATSLSGIHIPSTVTSIGSDAFYGATSLSGIHIPSTVTSIGSNAFYGATSLSGVYIPSTVTSIGSNAFYGALELARIYFLGNAPSSVGDGAFADLGELATAYIQPNAQGFETSGDPALWNGLLVDAAGFTPPLPLYRNWQTSLAEITNGGPKAGETVYASAFERALPRTLYKNESNYRTDVANYPTPEEYVYRITKQPNSRTSSVDHQSSSSYDGLDSDAQAAWYGELGFTAESPYQFTWKAFVCVNQEETAITKPTGLSLSYASREDGLLAAGGFNAAHNLLFKNAAINWHQTINPGQSSRSAVGYLPPDFIDTYTRSFLGELDPAWHSLIWGFLDVNGSCAAGTSLKALTILDSSNSPITTKSFAIPEQLNLDLAGNNIQFSSIQVTIGVTGGSSRRDFNAALWGLTTIAETSEPPPAPPAPPIRREPTPTPTPEPAPTPAPTPAPAATTNLQPSTEMLKVGTVYLSTGSYFLNNATKISLRKFAREVKASDKKVVLVYGYTDNRGGVNNTWLSQQRAKAVANYIRPMLKGKKIVIGWYSSGKPVSTGTTAAALALNRRVEIYTK
jgi:outer membrane protein OmpA-like peptidoglycan-associated protein